MALLPIDADRHGRTILAAMLAGPDALVRKPGSCPTCAVTGVKRNSLQIAAPVITSGVMLSQR